MRICVADTQTPPTTEQQPVARGYHSTLGDGASLRTALRQQVWQNATVRLSRLAFTTCITAATVMKCHNAALGDGFALRHALQQLLSHNAAMWHLRPALLTCFMAASFTESRNAAFGAGSPYQPV